MPQTHWTQKLGPPHLELAGLQLWVQGQPHANSTEPSDADWLTVTVHCGEAGASVWVSGEILTSSAVEAFMRGCEQIYATLSGTAWLAPPEPNLAVSIASHDRLGHLFVAVDITPDHIRQKHHFEFELDQTFLPAVIRQCAAILARDPNPHGNRDA